MDVFFIETDTAQTLKSVYSPRYLSDQYDVEIEKSGRYFIRVQSKLKTDTNFEITFNTKPVFTFPVAGGKNADIGSFWGDPRDGGKRKHKGIDIFAKKGTPLVAVSDARVSTVRNRGLGGKQIWLHDAKRKLNIYYAHLDSQYVNQGQAVFRGDTIGTVGNTGNARTTPPHLHFGIYKSFSGAINPLDFVKVATLKFTEPTAPSLVAGSIKEISNVKANFRASPHSKNSIVQVLQKGDQIKIIGVSGDWYHVRTVEGTAGYLHKSLINKVT
nr:M23 family metallopeptidase [Portibacter lacus]